jgi:hypothetical protein
MAGGMFAFHVFAALAEFLRTIIVANNEGLAAARTRGQRLGRPPAMTAEKIAYAPQQLAEPARSAPSPPCSASRATPSTTPWPSSPPPGPRVPDRAQLPADSRPAPSVEAYAIRLGGCRL